MSAVSFAVCSLGVKSYSIASKSSRQSVLPCSARARKISLRRGLSLLRKTVI